MTISNSDRLIQMAFTRLTREQPRLTELDRRLMAAFERLMLGQLETSNGAISVANICTEADVSRASYYRSPVATAIKQILATPQVARPEIEDLRAQLVEARKNERELRAEKAAEIRELTDINTVYANQIQVQALRIAELIAENDRLRKQLERLDPGISVLPHRTGPAGT